MEYGRGQQLTLSMGHEDQLTTQVRHTAVAEFLTFEVTERSVDIAAFSSSQKSDAKVIFCK